MRPLFRIYLAGFLALLTFLLAWHLLTKYRVNIYVRFLNVPAPVIVWTTTDGLPGI